MDTPILTNHFLIAMPGLKDPNFSGTLSYICEHSPQGTMGIVINRPAGLTFGAILEQLSLSPVDEEIAQRPVFIGGPVQQERGFVLHNDDTTWDSTLKVVDGISITTSRDILEAIAAGEGPEKSLMALGYAGWSGGQLEREMSENAWLSCPAEEAIIFTLPFEQRLSAAARQLGIDLNLLSSEAGHA